MQPSIRIRKEILTKKRRVKLWNMVCHLHKIGINHGDLEGRNVVRTADGRDLRLIDFHMSKTHECRDMAFCRKQEDLEVRQISQNGSLVEKSSDGSQAGRKRFLHVFQGKL